LIHHQLQGVGLVLWPLLNRKGLGVVLVLWPLLQGKGVWVGLGVGLFLQGLITSAWSNLPTAVSFIKKSCLSS
jgi:hypothetical protein